MTTKRITILFDIDDPVQQSLYNWVKSYSRSASKLTIFALAKLKAEDQNINIYEMDHSVDDNKAVRAFVENRFGKSLNGTKNVESIVLNSNNKSKENDELTIIKSADQKPETPDPISQDDSALNTLLGSLSAFGI